VIGPVTLVLPIMALAAILVAILVAAFMGRRRR
jgi:hypothetical protein